MSKVSIEGRLTKLEQAQPDADQRANDKAIARWNAKSANRNAALA